MLTQMIKIEQEKDFDKLKEPALALREGALVAIPTETVYGLGANAFLADSVSDIFKVKGRPSDNPLIVHIADRFMVEELAQDIPPAFHQLADKFWPGPLTMIVKKKDTVPSIVSAGLDTVGIRMPANEVALEFIRRAQCPVAAPSANLSGGVSATTAKYVYEDFKDKIPYIIDGGSSKVGLESTVLDLTKKKPTILRPGGITFEALKEVLPNVVLHESLKSKSVEIQRPASPGMKYKHYSPKCSVCLVCGRLQDCEDYILKKIKKNECVFAFSEQKKLFHLNHVYALGSFEKLQFTASKIFEYMRDADNKGYEKIYLSSIEEKGMGLAIMNRIKKSAADNTVNLKKILFVCTGNTCRSPIAEYLLKAYEIEGLQALSRGLYVPKSAPMSEHSKTILKNNQIECAGFMSNQLTKQDLEQADVVYTMTKRHRDEILNMFPQFENKVFTLKENGDIVDPFMQDFELYERTYEEIETEIKRLFDEFKN